MPKQHVMITVDRETYDIHRARGSNMSEICNTALKLGTDDTTTVEDLQNAAIERVAEGSAAIDAVEQAKEDRKAELKAQLNLAGTAYVQELKHSLQQDAAMINRVLKRCSIAPEIPRETFNIALSNAAERQGMTALEFANKTIDGGNTHIDEVFIERTKPKEEKGR